MSDEQVLADWSKISCRWPTLFEELNKVDLRMSAGKCASALNLSSVEELERELRRRHLVRYRLLRDWWYVIRLHEDAGMQGSLAEVARSRGDYLSVLTRFVVRVSGREWRTLARMEAVVVRGAALSAWRASGLDLSDSVHQGNSAIDSAR